MFSLICAWINDWVNNLEAGDLRRHVAHYDVTVMFNSKEDIMLKVNYNGVDVAGAIVISTMHENMMMMMMMITRLPVTIITLYAWVTEHVPSSDTHRAICNCLLNRLFRHRSKKTSKLRVTGLCDGKSLVTGEFPAQRASNTENVSIWWRHDGLWTHCDNCIESFQLPIRYMI